MKPRTLTPAEFQAYASSGAVSSTRISYAPALSWHKIGTRLGINNAGDAAVFKSAERVIVEPDQTAIHKESPHTLFAIKFKKFKKKEKAEAYIELSQIATRIPHAKIKPSVLIENEHEFFVATIMAELRGQTLAKLLFKDSANYKIQKKLTLSAIETLEIMLAAALDLQSSIHASGVIHRDITPANVMVDRSVSPPVVRIFDFDHCKLVGTIENEGCGTPLFMSAEALNWQNKTAKTDVYGLGWLYYLLLRGKFPQITTMDDVRYYAANMHGRKLSLFADMKYELDAKDRASLAKLVIAMFNPVQERRWDLQHCIDVVEGVLQKLKLKSLPPADRTVLHVAYGLGKSLRNDLVGVAFETRIGHQPSIDIVARFNYAIACVARLAETSADAFPAFLSALRIDMLAGVKIDELSRKVQDTMSSFTTHYQLIKNLQHEAPDIKAVLGDRPGKTTDEFKEINTSIDYLLQHYELFSWSLDSLAWIDRKLVKMLDRAQPIFVTARQAVAEVRADEARRSAEWARFMAERRGVQQNQQHAEVEASGTVITINGKRKM